jgi:KipI family sensor histidine kinase inhibitor
MRIRSVGMRALLIEVDDPAAWFVEARRRRASGELAVVDIVPGARTILLDGLDDIEAATAQLRAWPTPSAVPREAAATVTIPVRYEGEDLAAVAEHWQIDRAGVAERLAAVEFTVAFCGFTPGFAYLTGLPTEWAVPRLATPRARVPAGSVALADAYAGIYPTASPGGWRIVGHTDVTLFEPARTPPALLTPGTRVRFVAVGTSPSPRPAEAAVDGSTETS